MNVRFFNVEPRRIEPLNPSANHGLPHQRWPLELHDDQIIIKLDKKKAREINPGLSGSQLQPVVSIFIISPP